MSYTLRELRPGEAQKLKKLAMPNFSVVEQLFFSKPKLGVVAQTEDGTVAGASFLVVAQSGESKVGCIDIIFVLPEFRGTGVAKLLYSGAVAALEKQGCETIMALVRGDNSQSLMRFKAVGLNPVPLGELKRRIGLKLSLALFAKTASLACGTGCWVLCNNSSAESIGSGGKNLWRVLYTNLVLLAAGAVAALLLHTGGTPLWNMLAAVLLLGVMTLGETIGRAGAKGDWRFVMPQGGLVPSTIVALFGGVYPMAGHWYLKKRENSAEYRRKMAAPALTAWLLLLAVNAVCCLLHAAHPLPLNAAELGVMLTLLYALPFYPFDTFGGRRVREWSPIAYGLLAALSAAEFIYMLVA